MDDFISRKEAIKAIDDLPNCYNGFSDTYDKACIIGVLEELPTVDPVKRGKWLPHPTEPDWDVCSVCGIGTHRRFHYNDIIYGQYDVEESFMYCPHCGAKIDGGKNDDDGDNITGN